VFAEIPTLTTERLDLVPPSAAAATLYDEFYTDPEASMHYGGPLTAGQASARLAHDIGVWELTGFGVWVVRDRGRDALVGVCGFWQGLGWPIELTWWLLPAARGSGIATEASGAAVEHAHRSFGWPSIETYMEDRNTAARRLRERLGGAVVERRTFPKGLERHVYRIPRPA
jgi:[ribosomal protein S5]-alanine N-acetyltransferase